MLLDGTHGAAALRDAERARLWLAQPVERPASRPLEFEAASLAAHLEPWPATLTVKCLCLYHPDDRAELRGAQERNLLRLAAACRAQQRELLLEIAARGLISRRSGSRARSHSRRRCRSCAASSPGVAYLQAVRRRDRAERSAN